MNKKLSDKKNEIIGFLLIVLGVFIFLSLISSSNPHYWNNQISYSIPPNGVHDEYSIIELDFSSDAKETNNFIGVYGDTVYYFLRYNGFGIASIIIPITLILWGWTLFRKKDIKKTLLRSAHLFTIMLFLSIYSSGITSGSPLWSGNFGISIYDWLHNRLYFGLWMLGCVLIFLYISFIFNLSIYQTFKFIITPFIKIYKVISKKVSSYYQRKKEIKIAKAQDSQEDIIISIDNNEVEETDEDAEEDKGSLEEEKLVEEDIDDAPIEDAEEDKGSLEEEKLAEDLGTIKSDDSNEIEITEEQSIEQVNLDALKERKAKLFNYKLPSIDFLNNEPDNLSDMSEEVLRAKGEEIITALATFGVSAKLVGLEKGPVITLYKVEPAEGVRVNKFINLSDDLARVMKASRIRILAPIPGTNSVGIELPNENPKIVYLKNIINSEEYAKSESKLTIGLGKTTKGDAFCFDLQKMPHLLVAGATGAGKSVCINTIIVSILYKAKPDEVKFILIDPKKLELATYKSLVGYHLITAPGLDEYVMTTAENAVGILDSAITEMERRFELFASIRVRNIQEYHEKQKIDTNLKKIPYVVILIDELADLMMTSGRAIEDPITRLAQKARSVGLHLVVATQRPSVDVITGLIKSNFPARISFQVAQKIDSRTIIDQMGAEKLLGKGDLLFLEPGSASPIRLHNAFITLEEIEKLMTHISSQSKPDELLLPESKKESFSSEASSSDGERDELLIEAAKLVIQNQQASVSLLQRKLKIGYSRAGRLVDELEALGIISGYSGSKARNVLVDESYLDKIFN